MLEIGKPNHEFKTQIKLSNDKSSKYHISTKMCLLHPVGLRFVKIEHYQAFLLKILLPNGSFQYRGSNCLLAQSQLVLSVLADRSALNSDTRSSKAQRQS